MYEWIMFQGLTPASRCIRKKKKTDLELDVEHTVPSARY